MDKLNEIRLLIGKNNTNNAIEELGKYLKSKKDINTLIQIKSTFKQLSRERNGGELSSDEYSRGLAKVNRRVLELIDSIERKDNRNIPDRKRNLKFIIIGLLLIGGVASLLQMYFNDSEAPCENIAEVANKYELMKVNGINSHLTFTIGDLKFWEDQKMTCKDISRHFIARERVLVKANNENRKISTQGDLAFEAEILMIKEIAEKYDLFSERKVNPNLALNDGDLEFWRDKKLSLSELERAFKIMKSIIEDAERTTLEIKTKGDLGYLIEEKLKEK